jgi:hypothetical protein
MAKWSLYSALVTKLGNLTFLVRDDGQASPSNEIRTVTQTKLAEFLSSDLFSGAIDWPEQSSSPGSPASGKMKLYFKTDEKLYKKNPGGTETEIGAGGEIYEKYIITPSVASNNLTLAMKYIDGSDPSSTKPLKFRVGNTEYSLTAAMSFTKNAGTNWCNLGSAELAALSHDLFVYAIGETGGSAGLKFGYSRISWAQTMGDFVNTSTNEKYIAGNWTNFNSTDPVTVIGRFRAQLSAAASYNWSIPAANVVNKPIFESDWMDWTVAFTGFSAAPSNLFSRYKVVHGGVRWTHRAGTDGTSNATTFTITMPFTPKNNTNNNQQGIANAVDNGAALTTPCRVGFNNAAGNVASIFKDMASGTWTASAGKRIGGMQIVEMEV